MALFKQNKERAMQARDKDDNDALEQAFLASNNEKEIPKKRTREDLVKELKAKRDDNAVGQDKAASRVEEAAVLEEAKKLGKFKPIGFTLVGDSREKRKKKKNKSGLEGEKKKRKTEDVSEKKANNIVDDTPVVNAPLPPTTATAATQREPEPEPEPDPDLDIFAGVDKYEGIDLSEDGSDGDRIAVPEHLDKDPSTGGSPKRWFMPEDGEDQPPPPATLQSSSLRPSFSSYPPPRLSPDEDEEGEQPERRMRLVPLESSAVPSIKDLLALDGAQDKKKYKGKKKGEGGKGEKAKLSAESKADRDYKRYRDHVFNLCVSLIRSPGRLKSYSEKKTGEQSVGS
jgi:IK cytokine